MKIFTTAFLLLSLTISCQSENSENDTQQKTDTTTTEEQDTAVVDTLPLTPYQLNKQAWENEIPSKLPEQINEEPLFKKVGPCDFESILQVSEIYFLTRFTTGTDVQNSYYVTFDMNGNFLDAIFYGTETFGANFTTNFIHDNLIKVINFHEEGFEIDSYGDDSFDHLGMVANYIYLKDNGIFQSIKTRNSKLLASEIDSKIFDYYTQKANEFYPNLNLNLTPFDKIPGNNKASNEDVYESLEGGGLYSSCLEFRNSNHDLIGVAGYRNEGYADSIPLTFVFVFNPDKKPIIHYSIISEGGKLYLEVVRILSKSNDRSPQIRKAYYEYGYDHDTLIQTPVHTVKGSLTELFEKPLGKGDVENLRVRSLK